MKSFGNLLVFNLATDASDPVLGFTTDWLKAIASRCQSVYVITMRRGVLSLPPNVTVYSCGYESGAGKTRRAIKFFSLLYKVCKEHRIDGCFSHMMPVFSVLGAFFLKCKGIPLITWYGHPECHAWIRWSARLSDRLVTALPRSFGGLTPTKLRALGQGINVQLFSRSPIIGRESQIICVGRISRSKRLATLIRALRSVLDGGHANLVVKFVGAAKGTDDCQYQTELLALVSDLELDANVQFIPGVAREALPVLYRSSILHVNLTPVGFADKVVPESLACGTPSLAANEDYRETFGKYSGALTFRLDDSADLSSKIQALLDLPSAEYDLMCDYLHERVLERHSLNNLVANVLNLMSRLRGPEL